MTLTSGTFIQGGLHPLLNASKGAKSYKFLIVLVVACINVLVIVVDVDLVCRHVIAWLVQVAIQQTVSIVTTASPVEQIVLAARVIFIEWLATVFTECERVLSLVALPSVLAVAHLTFVCDADLLPLDLVSSPFEDVLSVEEAEGEDHYWDTKTKCDDQ